MITGYSGIAVGILLLVFAPVTYHDLRLWPFSVFVAAVGMALLITGLGYLRAAKKNTC